MRGKDSQLARREEVDVSRRDLVGVVGAVGGVLGLAKFAVACTQPVDGPIAASTQALTGAYTIDFVADCGADPTGNADCGPALVLAGQKLAELANDPRRAGNSAVLDVPPGIYRVRTSPGTWNFLGGVANVLVRGYKDASVFICDSCNDTIFNLGNCSATFENLTFVGTDSHQQGVPDCSAVIVFGYVDVGIVRECKFIYLWAAGRDLGVIYANYSDVRVIDCQFLAAVGDFAAIAAGGGTISLSVAGCRFIDYGVLNGFAFAPNVSAKLDNSTSWIRLADCNSKVCRVSVVGCYMDEGVRNAIRVAAGPSKVSHVRIADCFMNIPDCPAGYSLMHFTGVKLLEIDGVATNVASANPDIPAIMLFAVDCARIRGWTQDATAIARYVTADTATRYVRIEGSDFDARDIRSSASTTEVQLYTGALQVEAVVGTAACATAAGSVLKIVNASNAVGYGLIGNNDAPLLAVGVAVDAVNSGSMLRIALPGQRVSMISDGTTAICVGDVVSTFGAAAPGQVVKASGTSGTPIVGTAMSPAPAGPPVAVDIFFQPGNL